MFTIHSTCRVLLRQLTSSFNFSVCHNFVCSLRTEYFLSATFQILLELARSLSPCLWSFSKKHVGPGVAVESTTGGSEKETKPPPVPLEVGYVARLTGNGVEELSDKEEKKRKKYTLRPRKQLPSCVRGYSIDFAVWGNWQFVASDFQLPSFFIVKNASFPPVNISLGTDKKRHRKIIKKKHADEICIVVISILCQIIRPERFDKFVQFISK